MARIKHIALTTSDPAKAAAFYKEAFGLTEVRRSPRGAVFLTDGYINVEEYVNEIAEWPAPYDIVWTGGNNRYAAINNWSITRSSPGEADTTTHWQPSRFDTAIVNARTYN